MEAEAGRGDIQYLSENPTRKATHNCYKRKYPLLCQSSDLAFIGHTEPRSCSLTPPWWDGEENQKEKAKFMGLDKNSSTEQQREKKITTIILIKRTNSMQ